MRRARMALESAFRSQNSAGPAKRGPRAPCRFLLFAVACLVLAGDPGSEAADVRDERPRDRGTRQAARTAWYPDARSDSPTITKPASPGPISMRSLNIQ